MKRFVFFRGYGEKTISEQLEEIVRDYSMSINTWDNITPTIPIWQIFPDTIRYDNPLPNYGITYTPNFNTTSNPNYTITTTQNYHGTGYVTIPYTNTGTATAFSLTTSNPNGTTYTTAGIGGNLTTKTAMYSSSSFKM